MLKIGVTGHRPDKLGGYNPRNPVRVAMREAFKEYLLCLIGAHLLETGSIDAEVYVGMAQGWDTDCAEVCIAAQVPFVACVPFDGQEKLWDSSARRLYKELLAKAKLVNVLGHAPTGKNAATHLLHRRNAFIVENCSVIVAAFDGSPGGTAVTLNFARSRKRKEYILNPRDYAPAYWQGLRDLEMARQAEERRRRQARNPSVDLFDLDGKPLKWS